MIGGALDPEYVARLEETLRNRKLRRRKPAAPELLIGDDGPPISRSS